MKENYNSLTGFTLTGMLVSMAVIIILIGMAVGYTVSIFLPSARDNERIATLNRFKNALAIYYQKYGHYPPASGTGDQGYRQTDPSGTYACNGDANDEFFWGGSGPGAPPVQSIKDDASLGLGIIKYLGGYCNPTETCNVDADCDNFPAETCTAGIAAIWNSPLNNIIQSSDNNKWNCRYLIKKTSETVNTGGPIDWLTDYPEYLPRCESADCPHPDTYPEIQNYMLHCRLETNFEAAQSDGGLNDQLYEVFEPNPWVCLRQRSDASHPCTDGWQINNGLCYEVCGAATPCGDPNWICSNPAGSGFCYPPGWTP